MEAERVVTVGRLPMIEADMESDSLGGDSKELDEGTWGADGVEKGLGGGENEAGVVGAVGAGARDVSGVGRSGGVLLAGDVSFGLG